MYWSKETLKAIRASATRNIHGIAISQSKVK